MVKIICGGLAALLIIALATTFAFIPSYEECKANDNKHYVNPESTPVQQPGAEPSRADSTSALRRCFGEFLQTNNGAVQAVAAVVVGCLTVVLGLIAWSQLQRTREVERAYIVGGGTVIRDEAGQRYFRVDIANYGKTPAYVSDFGLEFTFFGDNKKKQKVRRRFRYDDQLAANQTKQGIKPVQITDDAYQVAFGQFWYQDIWHENRTFRFILTLRPEDTYPDISRMHPSYRHRT
jgi:hypothetical protein